MLIETVAISQEHMVDALVVVMLATSKVFDHFKGKRRDHRQTKQLDDRFAALEASTKTWQTDSDEKIQRLFAFIIGPDGQNGIRGDQRKLAERVGKIEERERNPRPQPRSD